MFGFWIVGLLCRNVKAQGLARCPAWWAGTQVVVLGFRIKSDRNLKEVDDLANVGLFGVTWLPNRGETRRAAGLEPFQCASFSFQAHSLALGRQRCGLN
jgi:hypothetical protein